MSDKVSFVKWSQQPFNTLVQIGGIVSAELMSKPYLNEWGETVCDVFWDNDPFASPGFPETQLAMYIHFRKCVCHCGCGNIAEKTPDSVYLDDLCNNPCTFERHDLPRGT